MTSQNTPAPNTAAEPHDASEQTRIRMEKRAKLIERGVEAYPVGVERTHSLTEIREKYAYLQADETTGDAVGVTGRIVFIRNTGKLCFATLQEGGLDGKAVRLQVMLSLANIGEEALAEWKSQSESSSNGALAHGSGSATPRKSSWNHESSTSARCFVSEASVSVEGASRRFSCS